MNDGRDDRVDRVLILARGQSRRLGSPKGLAVAADDARPLLERIADLYTDFGLPVLVLAGPDSAAAYAELLKERPEVDVLEARAGGGTARTVGEAWAHLGRECTHLWVHPVDVPGVRPDTLHLLARESADRATEAVRPSHGDRPGHPVILPAETLARCDEALDGGLCGCEGDMREALATAGATVREIGIDDAGTTRDYDNARDLAAGKDRPRESERRAE